MECECIEMETLDMGYDVFYVSLTYETLVCNFTLKILNNTIEYFLCLTLCQI